MYHQHGKNNEKSEEDQTLEGVLKNTCVELQKALRERNALRIKMNECYEKNITNQAVYSGAAQLDVYIDKLTLSLDKINNSVMACASLIAARAERTEAEKLAPERTAVRHS